MVELNHPELLSNCVRCRDSNIKFNTYSIEKTLGTKIIQGFTVNFSVCDACKDEINRMIETEKDINIYRKLLIVALITSILVIWLVTALASVVNLLNFVMAIVGTVISFLSVIILGSYLSSYLHKNGIEKYIEIKKDGRTILKDPVNEQANVKFDILAFYNQKFVEKTSETLTVCPHCGSQQKTYTGFCADCGKNLKKAVQN